VALRQNQNVEVFDLLGTNNLWANSNQLRTFELLSGMCWKQKCGNGVKKTRRFNYSLCPTRVPHAAQSKV